MTLNLDRIAAVLAEGHSYYGGREPGYRADGRMTPGARDLLGSQFKAGMAVLDVGCGNGGTLIEHAGTFAEGLGIDNDPAHLALAVRAAAGLGRSTAAGSRRPAHRLVHRAQHGGHGRDRNHASCRMGWRREAA